MSALQSDRSPQIHHSPSSDQTSQSPITHHPSASDPRGPSPSSPETDHFAHAHGNLHHKPGRSDNHDGHEPLGWQHLVKPPVIRQWLYRGRLFKGRSKRQPTYVELFFDLTFVGIIHQLAEGAVEPYPSGLNVAKFILVYYPSFSIWSNVRDFINLSGTDDILQRLYVLINMILLIGFSANATGIEIERNEQGVAHINPETYSAIHAAAAFLLIAKAFRAGLYLIYMILLPKFRAGLGFQLAQLVIPAFIWLPLTVLGSGEEGSGDKAVIALASVAVGVDMGVRWVGSIWVRVARESLHTPALSIEHAMERTTAFVVIVLGENILNAVFAAHGNQIGLDDEFGCAALAIVIAFEIMWLYFDADSSRMFIHALRRHWITNIIFTQIHWILSGALILASAAQKEMVVEREVERGYRWYFGAGLGVAVLCTAVIGWCHDGLDIPGSPLLPRWSRLILRVLVSILLALLPLTPNHSTRIIFGYYAAILAGLIIIETVGKIGSQGDWQSADIERELGEEGGAEREQVPKDKEERKKHLAEKADLTETERGEEDAGVESGLTDIEVRAIRKGQRLAYTA